MHEASHVRDLGAGQHHRDARLALGVGELGGYDEGEFPVAPLRSRRLFGADLPEHVDEAFAAAEWRLPAEERQLLDEVSEVKLPDKWA